MIIKSKSIFENQLITIIFLWVLIINFWAFYYNQSGPSVTESPLKIIFATMLILIFPGMCLAEILNFSVRHFLEWIGLSFAFSIVLNAIIALLVLFFNRNTLSGLYVLAIFLTAFVLFISYRRYRGRRIRNCLERICILRRPINWSTLIMVACIAILSLVLYRWGTNISGRIIAGEQYMHLAFVRKLTYLENITLSNFSYKPNLTLPNLIPLWEFILASISRLSSQDPLIVFARVRYIVFLLGISVFYYMTLNIVRNYRLTEYCTWFVVIGSISGFFTDYYPRADVSFFTRGVLKFMPQIHHSDVAMDLLLPLLIGTIFLFLYRPRFRHGLLMFLLLIVAFLWHVREFFQTTIYLIPIAVAMFIWLPRIRKKIVSAMLVLILLISVSSILFYGGTQISNKSKASFTLQRESTSKQLFIEEVRNNWSDSSNIADFFQKFRYKKKVHRLKDSPYNIFTFFILFAVLFFHKFLAYKGSFIKSPGYIGMIFTVTVLLAVIFSSSFLQKLLAFLTYSEINKAPYRIVYLFYYLVWAVSLYLLLYKIGTISISGLSEKVSVLVKIVLVIILAIGLRYLFIISCRYSLFKYLSKISLIMAVSLGLLGNYFWLNPKISISIILVIGLILTILLTIKNGFLGVIGFTICLGFFLRRRVSKVGSTD